MDSPEPANTISSAAAAISASATASSDSPVQESPFSNFLSSLSPINSVKAAHVPQGFLGLSSPPLVFTSPRTILHQRTSFLQRSQLSHISSFETPEKVDGSKNLENCSDDLKEPETYCRALIDDIEDGNDVKNNMQDQPGSLSGCEEYLNDSGDCINSASSIEQNVKQSNDILQSSISSLSIANSDEQSHSRAEVDTSSALFEPIKEDPHGQSYKEMKPLYTEEEQIKSKRPHNESDSSINHDHEINQSDVSRSRANEEYVENMKTTLQGSIQSVAQCDLEVSQLQRGLSRRCLQFEHAGRKTDVKSLPCSSQRGSDIGSKSPTYATEMGSLGSPHVDLTASSSKKQMLNLSELANSAFPPRSTGKSKKAVSKPSGIGLHLNSIALPVGSHSSLVAIKSTPIMNSHHVDNKGYSEKLSKLVEKVAFAPADDMPEPLSSLARSAVNTETCQTVKPLNTTEANEHYVTPLNKRNCNLEHADNFEESSQLSPTKKKRKISSSADGDGCKRCNCKKTKCLKLYCDCFAAGIYCAESCACQGCFNKPEHEDTVMETRQLIESRNPLAFAPKVVQRVAECAAFIKEDGSRAISSLARHKKGCNCKKSLCLKKYCECYQATVGCSSECRCEGCRNSYGRKEEYHASEEILHKRVCKESSGGRDEHNLGMTTKNKGFLQAELQDPHNLTSSTPSFQHSDHVKDAAKFQCISSRYAPSPESDFSNVPSCKRPLRSPRNSLRDMILEGNEETLDIDCFDREMDDNVSEMMDQFSSRCDAQAGMCDLTPSQNSSITTLASSASSKTKGHVSTSRFQLCSGSGHFSSVRSLRWRSSPISPMPQLGGTENDNDSDSGLYDILGDETPEILKEASTPIASLKATSPNKKRVSPPHNHFHGLRPSSSVGLRSGRKFILTAISSPSPLTRCDKSKGDTDEKSSNS